ncbi:MAG: class I SAM-dependent methyltransferase, partial [Bacillota bacterium]|nr:class I SAM-dependent methyltransferase [Bacillota bacterium]
MDISKRLIAIADKVDKCETVLDIGTDHGYIPIYLIKNKICNKVIASDINKGPLKKAAENIKSNHMDGIELRLGSGFNVVKQGEADAAVLAGMGGHLIKDLILEREDIFKKLEYAVFQPVQNPDVLRKFIINKGYTILDEDLVFDESIFYEIIKVRYNEKKREEAKIYYEIGRKLIDDKNPRLH